MAAISAAYIEAREALARIKNYRGDKRRRVYRRMAEASPVWRARMDNFAALLGLPTAGEVFYNDPAPEYCQPAQPAQAEQTKKHMTNKTGKALAGLKYGQTLTEDQAAAVAAEWQKALKKAGAAMRAAAGHFEITQPTAPGYPGPRYLVAGRYRGDLLAYLRDKVAETMARCVYYSSPFTIYNVVYKDYLATEEAAAALAARLKEDEKERARRRADRRAILANIGEDLREGLRLGANWEDAAAAYGDTNSVAVVEEVDRNGYSCSCKWAKVTRWAHVTIRRGYSLHLVGGLYTFIRGRHIDRAGMACEWVEQGRAFADTAVVRGYLVRGEHIQAASLAAAKRINADHRAARLGALMEERAQAAAELAQLEDVRVTFADSIAGGNCQPGTRSFIARVSDLLGYEPESLSGREVIEYGRRFGVELYARRAVKAAARREAGK